MSKPDWTVLFDTLTEDELVLAAGITHLQYRRKHPNPTEKLSDGAMMEIYSSDLRDQIQLARLYKTTTSQVLRATRLHCNAYTVYPPAVLESRVRGLLPLSGSEIAKQLNVSFTSIAHLIPAEPDKTRRKEINRLLAEGYSQQEVAETLDIAASTVSYYHDSKVTKPRKPKSDKWDEILERARNGEVIAHLAKEYNVGRTTILARLKK